MKVISAEEVAKHNTPDSQWIVNDGYVYDVSKFYKETPNGAELINQLASRESTKAQVYDLLDSYIIGELEEAQIDRRVNYINSKFKIVLSVFTLVSLIIVGGLIYKRSWIWLACVIIVMAEIIRKGFELHDELMDRAGANPDDHH